MATVRVAPNEVQVDEIIYTFADAGVADVFESCVATTGDVLHCAKEQIALHKRPADPGKLIAEVEPVPPIENWDRDEAPHPDRT
jgi:hypothetical protein